MKFRLFLLAMVLFLKSQFIFCQEFEAPFGYALRVASDYVPYEKDVIAAAKWLKATPLNEQEEKRRHVTAFVMDWINGSPTVNVEITPVIMDFEEKNKGMLVLYMAACARYVLENNYSKDMRAKHKAALADMMDVYKTGKGIKKDKKIEKLIRSYEEGNIDDWLKDNMKVG